MSVKKRKARTNKKSAAPKRSAAMSSAWSFGFGQSGQRDYRPKQTNRHLFKGSPSFWRFG